MSWFYIFRLCVLDKMCIVVKNLLLVENVAFFSSVLINMTGMRGESNKILFYLYVLATCISNILSEKQKSSCFQQILTLMNGNYKVFE